MKEYELLEKYRYGTPEGPFDVVSQAIFNKRVGLLNIPACKEAIEEVFLYLEVRERFDLLEKEASHNLIFTTEGFRFEGHTFQTMDEVERALKNKAFL